MRKHVVLAVCVGAVVLAAFLRYRDIWSWFWATQNVAACWFIAGIWLGKVSLNRTHAQLVKDEMSSLNRAPPLAQMLINGGMTLTVVAIVLHFVT